MLKYAYILYILACHLQIDAYPDLAYHFDADPDTEPTLQFDADPDPQHFKIIISFPNIVKNMSNKIRKSASCERHDNPYANLNLRLILYEISWLVLIVGYFPSLLSV